MQKKKRAAKTLVMVSSTFFSLFLWCAVGCRAPAETGAKIKGDKAEGHGNEVAVITLTGNMVEEKSLGDIFGPRAMVLRKVLDRLKKASRDSKIGKIVLRVGSLNTGWAQIHEIREALDTIRRGKKKVVFHLDEPNNLTYFLALSGDEIQLSPTSYLWLIGLRSEVIFLAGLLEKLGLKADMLQVGEYKGAVEPLTRKEMSKNLETSLSELLDGLYTELVKETAQGRNLPEEAVKKLIDSAPHSAKDAINAKLVDRVAGFRDSVIELAKGGKINWSYGKKEKAGSWSELLELIQPETTGKPPKEDHVAVVYAIGPIIYGGKQGGGLGGEEMVSSHELENIMNKLRDNEKVKSVVLRINSPGGSALASDILWLAVRRLAKKKPVIVSMGDVAASGGYYIASAGTKIFAQPMTITGSIGVMGGKIALGGLFRKIGVNRQVLRRGKNSDMFAPDREFSSQEREIVEKFMKATYERFLSRVAEGRRLSPAKVRRAAKGRVWTGRKAEDLGLVDEMGGISAAIAEARRAGKLPLDAKSAVYPRPKSWLELLQSSLSPEGVSLSLNGAMLGGGAHGLMALKAISMFHHPVAKRLRRLLLSVAFCQRERVLTLMPFDVSFE